MNYSSEVRRAIQGFSSAAVEEINLFTEETFQTRGKRAESGMGQLIEALWGYYVNKHLRETKHKDYELAWLPHQYNDFACLERNAEWQADTDRTNELLRIEAKSMYMGADESKGHFEGLVNNIDDDDLLLVILWEWEYVDEYRAAPYIEDSFIDRAKPLAKFRDDLHIMRDGSFLDPSDCPDCDSPASCEHAGEPLNAAGNRERIHGPEGLKPSNSSYGANFGGLVRMLGTKSSEAEDVYNYWRANNRVVHKYISFIHDNFPEREYNRYNKDEWKKVSEAMGIRLDDGAYKEEIVERVRSRSDYKEYLREVVCPDYDPTKGLG